MTASEFDEVVDHLPSGRALTSFSPLDDSRPPSEDLRVEITGDLTCWIGLAPAPAVLEVAIGHPDDEEVGTADRALAERLLQSDRAPVLLARYALALADYESGRLGRAQSIVLAEAVLDVIDGLGIHDDEGDCGVWPVWRTVSFVAGLALAQLSPRVGLAGGSSLRIEVAGMAGRFERSAPDRLTAGRLRQVIDEWPRSRDDQPDAGDATMLELERVQRSEGLAALAAERRRNAAPRLALLGDAPVEAARREVPLDVRELVDIGLVDPTAVLEIAQMEPVVDLTWVATLPVRAPVGAAYRELLEHWKAAVGSPPGPVAPERRREVTLAYARLLAHTHLPYSLRDLGAELDKECPAPPHLPSVSLVVRRSAGDGASEARFGLRMLSQGEVALRSVVLLPADVTLDSLRLELRPEQSPYLPALRYDKESVTQRILRLSVAHQMGPLVTRDRREAEELVSALRAEGRHDLADHLQFVVLGTALDPGATPASTRLLDALISSKVQDSVDLLAAVEAGDLALVERLATSLWRTRTYLLQLPS